MAVYKDKSKTRDGRQWYFKVYKKDLTGNNRAYKSKRYKKKEEAEEAERLFLMKRDNPLHKEFSLIAKDYLDNSYAKNNDSTAYGYEGYYNNHIKDFFSKYYIDEINIYILKQWQEYMLKKGLHINTLNHAYMVLKNIFKYAIKNYGLETDYVSILGPFQKKKDKVISDKEKIRYLTYDQFIKFISVIDDIMWKTFFTFLFYTGMRKGEVQALNWNDIDFDNYIITVNKSLSVKTKSSTYVITTTKTKENRKIRMSKHLQETMIYYKQEMMKYTDFNENWFVFGNSRFLSQTTIDRYKHNYFEKYNQDKMECDKINEITIHEFRHSHVSLLVNEYIRTSRDKSAKIDTAKFFLMMSERMGHTIEVMQEVYLHLFPTVQDEIVDLLDNL